MTEYELHILMQEQSNIFNIYLENWLVVTSALVISAFVAGSKINTGLRRLILFLYLAAATVTIISWADSIVGYRDYMQRLEALGGAPLEHLPLTEFLPIIMGFVFFAGTSGAVIYFVKAKNDTDT